VQTAKGNRVDGFIVKPFSKQKVDECINRYFATHKDKGVKIIKKVRL
jgi:hypothetical protein